MGLFGLEGLVRDETLLYLVGSAVVRLGLQYAWEGRVPPRAREVARVAEILIHPVKSAASISVQEADCTFDGLYYQGFGDRTWKITRKQGEFFRSVPAPLEPTIELIRSSFHGNHLHLEAPGMETLVLPKVMMPGDAGQLCNTEVLGRKTVGIDCGPESAQWLRKYLQKEDDFRLIYFSPELEKGDAVKNLRGKGIPFLKFGKPGTDRVSYQNNTPFSIGSEDSLADLNSRLEIPVSMRNFRMNIVVNNSVKPYDEDSWDEVWIGDAKFSKFFLCDRCINTTIDPDTAKKHPKQEPTTTLNKYRKLIPKTGAIFGFTLVANKPGKIRVGDPVYATKVEILDVGSAGAPIKLV